MMLIPAAPAVVGYRGRNGGASYAIALTAIIVLAAILRLLGVRWGIPMAAHPDFSYHPDEAYHILWARWLIDGQIIAKHFMYGGTLNYSVLNAYYRYGNLLGSYLGGVNQLANTILFGRYCSVFYSLLTLVVTAQTGRRLGDVWAGVLAATFLALAPAHAFLAQNVRPDELATLFATLLGYLCVLILQADPQSDKRLCGLFGILLGLSIALRFPLGTFGFALLGAVALREGAFTMRVLIDVLFNRRILVAAAGVLVGYLVGSPHSLVYAQAFVDGLTVQWSYQSGVFEDAIGRGSGLYQYGWFMLREAFGWPLYALVLVGVAMALLRRTRAQLLLLVLIAPYFVMMTLASWVVVRYTLPLLPFLALLAAIGLKQITRLDLSLKVAAAAVLGGAFLWIGLLDVAFLRVQRGDNVREQVSDWMAQHAKAGSTMACVWQYVGDYFYCPTAPASLKPSVLLADSSLNPGALTGDVAPDYLIVGEPIYANMDRLGDEHPKAGVRALRKVLRSDGQFRLVKQFVVPVSIAGINFTGQLWSHDFQIMNPGFRIYQRVATEK